MYLKDIIRGMTECFHAEAIVPDFIEQQELDDYYNNREEQKMQIFSENRVSFELSIPNK